MNFKTTKIFTTNKFKKASLVVITASLGKNDIHFVSKWQIHPHKSIGTLTYHVHNIIRTFNTIQISCTYQTSYYFVFRRRIVPISGPKQICLTEVGKLSHFSIRELFRHTVSE